MTQPFVRELDRAAGLERSVARQTAAMWTIAAALSAATVLVVIDRAGRFDDPGLRWVFSGLLAAATGAALWWGGAALRRLRDSRVEIARRVERARPELGSRLSSATAFHDQRPDDPRAGSAELRRAVVLRIANEAEGIDFTSIIGRQGLKRAARAAGAAAMVTIAAAAFDPAAAARGLARLAAPWSDLPWPRRNHLTLVEPPSVIALGEPLEITAIDEAGPLPEDIRVEYRADDGQIDQASMQVVGDQAVARREDVRRALDYRVLGGDDHSMPWRSVEVVEPPELTALEVTTSPPEYSGLPSGVAPGTIRVLEGTRIMVRGGSGEPLASARVVPPWGDPIEMDLLAGDAGPRTSFATPAEGFAAVPGEAEARRDGPRPVAATLRVRLEGKTGAAAETGQRPYEVLPDTPPDATWIEPDADSLVTARAVVPIRVRAEDDLAVASIDLEWTAGVAPEETDSAAMEQGPAAPPKRLRLADFGEIPPRRDGLGAADRREAALEWDLAGLSLAPGARLELVAAATDYRPSTGRSKRKQTLLVVSDEEFESILTQKQSQLLADVRRALEQQRKASDARSALAAEAAAGQQIDRSTLDRVAALEFEQRGAEAAVADPRSGAAARAAALSRELQRSRLDRPDLAGRLEAARDALASLGQGAMPDARRDLAAARRAAEQAASGGPTAPFAEALRNAEPEQAEAMETLERVAESLTGWADYQRFAEELAELVDRQKGLAADASRVASGAAASDPLAASERRAQREKLVGSQAELARRFGRLREAMQNLVAKTTDPSKAGAAAEAVADALAEADERDIAGALRNAGRELAMGRMGRAGEAQRDSAESLERMLDTLRERAPSDPEELARKLAEALERAKQLRAELARAPRGDAAGVRKLSDPASRLGRRLDRLTAPAAGARAAAAAAALRGQQQGGQQQGGQQQGGQQGEQPDPRQADEQLAEAEREIQKRVEELENQQAERALDKLRSQIDQLIAGQRGVLDATLRLDRSDAPQPNPGARETAGLQRTTRDATAKAAELVAQRVVFDRALRGATAEMGDALARLERGFVDRATQRRETAALARLKHVKDVLEALAKEQDEQKNPQGQQGGGQGGGEQRPSPIDVAEVRMLRLLQQEVMSRSNLVESDAARARKRGDELPEDLAAEAGDLSREQAELAELALEMAERHNDPDAPQAKPRAGDRPAANDPQEEP